MKTTAYILTVLFTFNVHFLNAAMSNPEYKSPAVISDFSNSYNWLAPTTPAVADFSDSEPFVDRNFDVLSPITPKEASFDELVAIGISNSIEKLLKNLSPITPVKADFNETGDPDSIEMLKPITPFNAGFDENH